MATLTKAQRLPNIPPALYDYPLFFDRLNGACGALRGDVALTLVFTDIPNCAWTEESRATAKKEHQKCLDRVLADAKQRGIRLTFRQFYHNATVDEPVTMQNGNTWAAKALDSAGLPPFDRACVELEKQYGAGSAPLCFCVNDPGRSYAHHGGSQESTEYMILFDSESLFHELCHLFGATDFYYPEKLADLAKKYYPDSIMQGSGSDRHVDGFTAYLMGWTDVISPHERKFLEEVEKIPLSAFNQASETEQFTGQAKEMRTRHGVYTGYMVDGLPEGRGKYYYHGGSIYDGEYRGGFFHGYGRYLGANGVNYHGEYRYGKKHGQGVMHWASGNRYVGQYEDDECHGQGEFRFINGDLYTGDFVRGERTGHGILVFTDGSRYEGGFLNGNRQGYGTFTWADGAVYTGDFEAGHRTGQGTIIWPDDSSYTGDFRAGVFHGEGRYIFSTGVVYLGSFADGKFHGQGEMIWPDGARYRGDFRDGKRTGQGTYTSPDGTVLTGAWEDGKYIG